MTNASHGGARPGRREAILAAFTRRVAERGYDGTNFADIAVELRMSKGTIVHHFGTKEQLLAEAHETYMLARLDEAHSIMAGLRTPAEHVAGLITAFVLYQAYDRDRTVAFQREVVRSRSEASMAGARALRDRYRELFTAALRAGVADGSFRGGDARLWALQLFGGTQWMWTWYQPDGGQPPEEVAASYVNLALGGLLRDRTHLAGLCAPDGEVLTVVKRALQSTAASPSGK